jgi:acyl carrier protein
MEAEKYASALHDFMSREFAQSGETTPIDLETELVETGILDSLRVAVLMTFIQREFGLGVPYDKVDAEHFRNIRTIAAMLAEAAGDEVPA